jgi:hypothetical protein
MRVSQDDSCDCRAHEACRDEWRSASPMLLCDCDIAKEPDEPAHVEPAHVEPALFAPLFEPPLALLPRPRRASMFKGVCTLAVPCRPGGYCGKERNHLGNCVD